MEPNIVLGVCGKIGSGKTTLAKAISNHFNWGTINLGDYVRYEASKKSIDFSRKTLQVFGANLMDQNMEQFCKNVLDFAGWNGQKSIILAGIRHSSQIDYFKKLISPHEFKLIYVTVDEATRKKRILDRSPEDNDPQVNQHSTEKEVGTELIKLADVILNGVTPIGELTSKVVGWLNKWEEDSNC